MVILDVIISGDRKTIVVITNFGHFDFSTAKAVINFPAGTLITSDGRLYQSSTASFPLNDPIFMESLYKYFGFNLRYHIIGIFFTSFSLILLIVPFVLKNPRAYH